MADIGIKLTADATGLQRTLNDAAGSVQGFGRTAGDSLKSVGQESAGLQSTMEGLANGLKSAFIGGSVVGGLIGLKTTLVEFRQELIATQVQSDKMRNGLSFAVGKNEVAGEMAFIKKSAQDLGLELVRTSDQYTKLAAAAHGTTMAGQGVRDIFTAMSQAGTVMGLSAQEQEGALRAVVQMISKGKVQAEELRGQLGEHLPGAFQIAARAIGVTTVELSKMLETGNVVASDFLPKFAAQLSKEVAPQVDEASKSMQASLNRMENSWTSLKRVVNEGGMGKAIQNEITGMSNYVQAISDTMANAKAAGGGGLSQINAAAANVLGRMPSDALAITVNTLNTAFNSLSMGALHLRTNFDFLPEVFKTNEQRLNNLAAALPSAEEKIAKLQARLAQVPDNIYLKDEVYQLSLFIAKAKEAKAASDKLKGMGTEDPTKAAIRLGGQAREAYEAGQKALSEDLVKVRMKLAGVDADYLPTLNKLQAMRESGIVSEKEYIRLVSDLAGANFKKAASEKVQGDSAVQDLKARVVTARQYLQAMQENGLEADKANEGEKLAAKLTQELLGKMGAKTRLSKEAQLVQAQNLAGVLKESDALKDVLTSREKANKAANKEYADDNAATEKINEKAAAIELEVSANESLAKAIEQTAISRLKEQRDILKSFDGSEEKVELIEAEIKARERLIAAMDSKDASDGVKKAAKEADAEWKRTNDEINRTLTDSLMRAFEDGKGYAEAFGKTVEAMFKTMVLRPIISAVMSPVSGLVNNVLSSIGIPGVGAASGAASGASTLGTLGSLGSAFSAFGGTMATGFMNTVAGTGFGASMGAAGSLIQGGATASGFGMAAGAIAPYAIAGLVLKELSSYKVEATGNALTATLGANGLTTGKVGTRADFKQTSSGILSGGDTINATWGEAGASVSAYFDSQVKAYTKSVKAQAAALGLSADAVDGFTKSIEISITGMDPAQQKEAIDKAISGFVSDMVQAAYGGALDGVAKEGETQGATLQRLATDFTVVNNGLNQLGLAMIPVGVEGAKAAASLVDAFGGLDAMNASVGAYYDKFYSDGEKAAKSTENLRAQFEKLGTTMPGTKEEFRHLVESIDITTESGRNFAASVIALAPAFDQAAESARAAANNMLSAIQNYGTSAEVRDFQVNQIGNSLRAAGIVVDNNTIANGTREQYRAAYEYFAAQGNTRATDALMSQQQAFANITKVAAEAPQTGSSSGGGGGGGASSALSTALSDWQKAAEAIVKTMTDLRSTLLESGPDSFAKLQAQFAIEAAQAKAGDAAAADNLPALAKSLVEASKTYYTTSVEQSLLTARVIDTLGSVVGAGSSGSLLSVPKFAGGGVHSGGWAMVGEQGPELAYMPPSRIYTAADTSAMLGGGGNAALLARVDALVAEVSALRASSNAGAVASQTAARVLTAAANGSAPIVMEIAT